MEIVQKDSKVIITTDDCLISANVSQYIQRANTFLATNPVFESIELDIAKTLNIDSMGITFITGLYKTCLNEGKQFRVVGGSDDIIHIFRLMKLDEFFELD